MRVLIVTAELAPLAEAGGVAQYSMGLARALSSEGHDVHVALPSYGFLPKDDPPTLEGITVHRLGRHPHFLAATSARDIYDADDFSPWIHFAKAVVDFVATSEWSVEIVHCQDCHTALVPVLIADRRKRTPSTFDDVGTVLTVHNLLEQGRGSRRLYDSIGVTEHAFDDYFEFYGETNSYKAGISLADRVSTVSQTYAQEITMSDEYGFGLSGVLSSLAVPPVGIVNGIDGASWRIDGFAYDDSDSIAKLLALKAKAVSELLPYSESMVAEPVIAFKGRWDRQKGIELVVDCLEEILERARFVFDTWGEPLTEEDPFFSTWQQLLGLAQRYPTRLAVNAPGTTNPEESAALYMLADFFLMPSIYEPCGLAQMECQRFGCIPIVRSTGGLADTVRHLRNGIAFHTLTRAGLLRAIDAAVEVHADEDLRVSLVGETLRQKNDWRHRSDDYLTLYESALPAKPANGAQPLGRAERV